MNYFPKLDRNLVSHKYFIKNLFLGRVKKKNELFPFEQKSSS